MCGGQKNLDRASHKRTRSASSFSRELLCSFVFLLGLALYDDARAARGPRAQAKGPFGPLGGPRGPSGPLGAKGPFGPLGGPKGPPGLGRGEGTSPQKPWEIDAQPWEIGPQPWEIDTQPWEMDTKHRNLTQISQMGHKLTPGETCIGVHGFRTAGVFYEGLARLPAEGPPEGW